MSKRDLKWYGWPYYCSSVAKAANGTLAVPAIVVFTENKDKEEARTLAKEELTKYGYYDIDIRKIVPQF